MKAKIKRLQINPEAFVSIMQKDTAWRVNKGIPKGATLRGVSIDPFTQSIIILIEHDSFPLVDVNQIAPLIETEFERIP